MTNDKFDTPTQPEGEFPEIETSAQSSVTKKRLVLTGWVLYGVAIIFMLVATYSVYTASIDTIAYRDELRMQDEEQRQQVIRLASLSNDVAQARERRKKDDGQLESMYEHCRASDDFFVVYKDKMTAISHFAQNNTRKLIFYLPEGSHRLITNVTFHLRSSVSGKKVIREPIRRELELTGGRAYEVIVTTQKEEETCEIQLPDQEPIIIENAAARAVYSRSPPRTVSLYQPRVDSDASSAPIKIIESRLDITDTLTKSAGMFAIRLEVLPEGAARYSPLDLTDRRGWPVDEWEYRDGWYYPTKKATP